jgi:hypothetical protein
MTFDQLALSTAIFMSFNVTLDNESIWRTRPIPVRINRSK